MLVSLNSQIWLKSPKHTLLSPGMVQQKNGFQGGKKAGLRGRAAPLWGSGCQGQAVEFQLETIWRYFEASPGSLDS